MPLRVRLGSRGSRLAMAQALNLQSKLQANNPGLEVEVITIKTSGDLGKREQLGAFVREIQHSLLRGEIDLALHCLKDLPTERVEGLQLSAYCEREDPRDVLISRSGDFDSLAAGAIVGTGSVRRTSQLAAKRPDLIYRPLAGNVDTRMRKLMAGEYDAIVLAIAGLIRLDLLSRWSETEYASLCITPFDVEQLLPAPGQAVLVIESRNDDASTQALIKPFESPLTRACADAEREFLKSFGGGCSVPVAALATIGANTLTLKGLVAAPDGSTVLQGSKSAPVNDGEMLARELAKDLGDRGAFGLFEARIPEPAEALP